MVSGASNASCWIEPKRRKEDNKILKATKGLTTPSEA
jgi:hypothetical protein